LDETAAVARFVPKERRKSMSAGRPNPTEINLLRMKLRKLGCEAVENEEMKPPITIVCTDAENTSVDVRIKMDLDTKGELNVVEEHGMISQLPPRITVRIIDADGKSKEVRGTK
jgi:hypothetical protein